MSCSFKDLHILTHSLAHTDTHIWTKTHAHEHTPNVPQWGDTVMSGSVFSPANERKPSKKRLKAVLFYALI